MQLQLNKSLALELHERSSLRNTGRKLVDANWQWGEIIGVGRPTRVRNPKTCFVAKSESGKREVLGRLSDSTGSGYRKLDLPFNLYALWREDNHGSLAVKFLAFRNVQLDPEHGDCGDLVFDTLEMSSDRTTRRLWPENLEACFLKTAGEFEAFIRRLYHLRLQQITYLSHTAFADLIAIQEQAKAAGVETEFTLATEPGWTTLDGTPEFLIGYGNLNTLCKSRLEGYEPLSVTNRSMVSPLHGALDGTVVLPKLKVM